MKSADNHLSPLKIKSAAKESLQQFSLFYAPASPPPPGVVVVSACSSSGGKRECEAVPGRVTATYKCT